MKVYLVRHGSAVSSQEHPERPLSSSGRDEVVRLAAYVLGQGMGVAHTWHSAKARARETAEILHAQGGLGGTLQERAGLLPEDAVEPVAAELESVDGDVCVVGHLPFMSCLAGALTTGDAYGAPMAFETGAMACLEREGRGAWVVRWFVSPRTLP